VRRFCGKADREAADLERVIAELDKSGYIDDLYKRE
jgi:hypothetical protein